MKAISEPHDPFWCSSRMNIFVWKTLQQSNPLLCTNILVDWCAYMQGVMAMNQQTFCQVSDFFSISLTLRDDIISDGSSALPLELTLALWDDVMIIFLSGIHQHVCWYFWIILLAVIILHCSNGDRKLVAVGESNTWQQMQGWKGIWLANSCSIYNRSSRSWFEQLRSLTCITSPLFTSV